jgi:DNA-binding protein HU-beta
MNKADIARSVADGLSITIGDAHQAIDLVLAIIHDAVADGEKVTIAGHGTYKPVAKAERTARNPATGAQITVPAKTVPQFVAASAFKDHVNGG